MALDLVEQLVDAVRVALAPLVPATVLSVERARTDAIAREECPCIELAIVSESADLATVRGDIHEATVTLAVAIHVHGGTGTWETVANALAVTAHPLITGVTLPAGVLELVGPTSRDWVAAPGDGRPAYLAMSYQAGIFRQAAALDAAS